MTVDKIPVIRAARGFGFRHLAQVVFALAVVAALVETILIFRPDLTRPTDIGSDTSNYFATAERLIHGHDLYVLSPGDRPVPEDNPPEWNAAILSPPSLPILFAPISLIPAPLGMLLWWACCFAALVVFLGLYAVRSPPIALLIATPLTVPLAITAWSGNINALIPAIALLVWTASEERNGRARLAVVAGILLAIGAAGKLGPLVFVPWLIGRQRWTVVASFALVGATVLGAELAAVGWYAIREYLAISSNAVQHATAASPVGIATLLGAPQPIAAAMPVVMIASSAILSMAWRDRPRATFAIAGAVSVLATPTARVETYGLLLICAIPWFMTGAGAQIASSAQRWVGAAVTGLGALALVTSFLVAPPRQSAVTIKNESSRTRVVRFQLTSQTATFGYRLAPGDVGAAWPLLWGSVVQPVIVYDEACNPVSSLIVPPGGGTIVLTDDGVIIRAREEAGALPYRSDCAGQLPPGGQTGMTFFRQYLEGVANPQRTPQHIRPLCRPWT